MLNETPFDPILALIETEVACAEKKHPAGRWGRHEFYGILLEEVEELWDAIKADEPLNRLELEATQVAAVVVRYLRMIRTDKEMARSLRDLRASS